MTPLRIEAHVPMGVCLPAHPIALDALLMAAVGLRDGLPPPANPSECQDLPIPIARERGVYMASWGHHEVDMREGDWTNRRFPVSEAQDLGSERFKRIQLGAGPTKSYRIPRERLYLRGERMTWWAVGDAAGVRELLGWIHYVGKRRAVGLGRVHAWTVEEVEPWGDGFPVLRDGMPTRSLPIDWPGIGADAERAYVTPTPPYWDHARRVACAVPSWEP